MKKLFAATLAAGMLLAMSTAAFAAETTTYVCPYGNEVCVNNGACINNGQCQNTEGCRNNGVPRHDGTGHRNGQGRGHHGGNRNR